MTDSYDAETRAAVDALAYRLRNHDPDTDPLGADAEPFAAEFVAALKARGWRPVLAVPVEADWRRASERVPRGSLDPDVKAALVTKMAEASQVIRTGRTGPQPALTEDDSPVRAVTP
jgi:hypothetical protein